MEGKKFIEVRSTCGYVGCEDYQYFAVDENWTEDQLEELAFEVAREAMDSYSYLETASLNEEDYDSDEDYDEAYAQAEADFNESIEGSYRFITEQEWQDEGGIII